MSSIPTEEENPHGLHQRYIISHADKSPVDEDAEYFILRLDSGGSDPEHIKACRKAAVAYARAIQHHLPQLAADLLDRVMPRIAQDNEDSEAFDRLLMMLDKDPQHAIANGNITPVKIKFRRDTTMNWQQVNPVLAEGEPGYDTDFKMIKVGDGSTEWRKLPYQDLMWKSTPEKPVLYSLIGLVKQFDEPDASPVYVRLFDDELQYQPAGTISSPADLLDEEDWITIEQVATKDMAHTTRVVLALGGDPDVVLKNFPNCDDY